MNSLSGNTRSSSCTWNRSRLFRPPWSIWSIAFVTRMRDRKITPCWRIVATLIKGKNSNPNLWRKTLSSNGIRYSRFHRPKSGTSEAPVRKRGSPWTSPAALSPCKRAQRTRASPRAATCSPSHPRCVSPRWKRSKSWRRSSPRLRSSCLLISTERAWMAASSRWCCSRDL